MKLFVVPIFNKHDLFLWEQCQRLGGRSKDMQEQKSTKEVTYVLNLDLKCHSRKCFEVASPTVITSQTIVCLKFLIFRMQKLGPGWRKDVVRNISTSLQPQHPNPQNEIQSNPSPVDDFVVDVVWLISLDLPGPKSFIATPHGLGGPWNMWGSCWESHGQTQLDRSWWKKFCTTWHV